MLRGFLLLAILTWHSTEQFRLVVERGVNGITLICRDQDDLIINVLQNTNVIFFLDQTDLASRTHLIRSETGASFQINPKLEGNYSCGTSSGTGSSLVTVMSQPPEPLIALPSTDGFPVNSEMVYAVQSSDGRVTIPCPFEPGNLQNCYFGQWTKDDVEIARIGKPDGSCANGGVFTAVDMNKYGIDRERFSLSITSVTAQEDSGQYQCRLKVANPATSTGQTEDLRSFPVTLIVDGQPNITKPPTDVVIGVEQEDMRLTEMASFECVALGRPAPNINWYYIVVNQDGSLGEPERLMNNERYRIVNDDGDEDPTGRFNSTSTLTMSVTESDGGIIRCKAGTTFADAHLTVLGEPFINIIATLRGEIIYDIRVKVRLNHPVSLNIAYQDVNSGVQLNRDSQPVESYNDTSEITFRENREDVPTRCNKCRVIVSFTAQMGIQIMQGLSVTSQDEIDLSAVTPEDKIFGLTVGIAAGITFLVVSMGSCLVIITAVACYYQKKLLKSSVYEKATTIKVMVEKEDCKERILDKLEELKKLVRTASDSPSNDTGQLDLAHVEQTLGDLLSTVETAKL